METKQIPLSKLHLNTGQIKDVPKNPRFIKDERFAALIYDRYGKMHRNDIENGMSKYKKYDKTNKIKAVLVVDKNGNLYEHQFDK